jgi:hypothetical protein
MARRGALDVFFGSSLFVILPLDLLGSGGLQAVDTAGFGEGGSGGGCSFLAAEGMEPEQGVAAQAKMPQDTVRVDLTKKTAELRMKEFTQPHSATLSRQPPVFLKSPSVGFENSL